MRTDSMFRVLYFLPWNQIVRGASSSHVSFTSFYRHSSSLMRAVTIEEHGPPSVLKVREVSKPVPSKTEVLVKVHAAGINPVDLYIREGAFMNLPPLPRILGKEAAGIVESVGTDVRKFKIGDRVTCCLPHDGGYAEYVTCSENRIIPLSEKLTFSQGASLYVAYFVAYRALITKCKIKKGEFLLVHGSSGAVGIAATQIAKSKGLKVIGTASSEAGLETSKNAGADFVFNHCEEGYLSDSYSITANKGFDVIIENCADTNLGNDLLVLSEAGRVAVVGTRASLKPPTRNPKLVEVNPRSLMFTEGSVCGVRLLGITQDEFNEYSNAITSGIEDGWLRPIIAQEFKLSQAPEAHQSLMSSEGRRGKLVFNTSL